MVWWREAVKGEYKGKQMTNQPMQASQSPHSDEETQKKMRKPRYHAVVLQIVNRGWKGKGETKKKGQVAAAKCPMKLPRFSPSLLSVRVGN